LDKDPTEHFQRHIQQVIQKCEILIDKHIIQIKPSASELNTLFEIRKDNELIRPVINNTHAPSYKVAKHLSKILNILIELLYTYTTKNSNEITQN
jgi:hypothetical protein